MNRAVNRLCDGEFFERVANDRSTVMWVTYSSGKYRANETVSCTFLLISREIFIERYKGYKHQSRTETMMFRVLRYCLAHIFATPALLYVRFDFCQCATVLCEKLKNRFKPREVMVGRVFFSQQMSLFFRDISTAKKGDRHSCKFFCTSLCWLIHFVHTSSYCSIKLLLA